MTHVEKSFCLMGDTSSFMVGFPACHSLVFRGVHGFKASPLQDAWDIFLV